MQKLILLDYAQPNLFIMRLFTYGCFCLWTKFENKRSRQIFQREKVYTSFEKISSESVMMVSPIGKNIWLRFAHDHGLDFAQLRWCSKEVLSVDSDADIVFLDKDGNTYNFKNKDYTLSTPGGGAVVAFGMNLLGVELTLIGNCSVFKDKTMTAIRIYTNDGYYDFDIKEKNAKKLIKTYSLFEKH